MRGFCLLAFGLLSLGIIGPVSEAHAADSVSQLVAELVESHDAELARHARNICHDSPARFYHETGTRCGDPQILDSLICETTPTVIVGQD
ncbi:MAG: hypothetical protein KDD44_13985, partial [Bdellovibrionales bacterium]|nr:hypothetical protein [Bdellovibrionales bacterium]